MKKQLFIKLLIGYVLFAIAGFIIVSTFSSNHSTEYLQETEANRLHREANLIASSYVANYYNDNITLSQLHNTLSSLGTYLDATIWVIDANGQVLLDTSQSATSSAALPIISDFNIVDFGSNFYQCGDFYGYFPSEYLSVFSTITVDYTIYGYVLIHKPVSSILKDQPPLLNITYCTLALFLLVGFLLFLLFIWDIYLPIRRMNKAAKAYADGDFSKQIPIHRNDELGYLSASFNYMANELNTLETDQRKFISNVSHDFRSPLTSIKGYVEAMLDGTIPVEMQEKYLNIIVFETDRLSKLTQGLLELNKYGSHGSMLDISEFDINQMIKNTCLTFEGICKEKRISFHLILTGETLAVKADESKIQRVVYNLIDNAIKFSHHDSEITIETTEKNGKVFISVKDTGIGIPKESLNKIWERFYKTDLSRGKDKKGSGLGLAIVKEIIQAHDENIDVISTEGVGTEFIFTLPLTSKETR
ncbi:MAG: ATP-binding protein [Roseburia sp.]